MSQKQDAKKKGIYEKLISGYKEMSDINLALAEESIAADSEAQEVCEKKLTECE